VGMEVRVVSCGHCNTTSLRRQIGLSTFTVKRMPSPSRNFRHMYKI
jgi:hypothetical protein